MKTSTIIYVIALMFLFTIGHITGLMVAKHNIEKYHSLVEVHEALQLDYNALEGRRINMCRHKIYEACNRETS